MLRVSEFLPSQRPSCPKSTEKSLVAVSCS